MEETPQAQPPQGGLFRRQAPPVQPDMTEEIQSIARRLRLLEERFGTMQKKEQVTEQNVIRTTRRFDAELKGVTGEFGDIKKEMADISERMKQIVRQLQTTARKEDVDVLKKYLTLWEPVNFVTQNQVERIVREAVEDMLEGKAEGTASQPPAASERSTAGR